MELLNEAQIMEAMLRVNVNFVAAAVRRAADLSMRVANSKAAPGTKLRRISTYLNREFNKYKIIIEPEANFHELDYEYDEIGIGGAETWSTTQSPIDLIVYVNNNLGNGFVNDTAIQQFIHHLTAVIAHELTHRQQLASAVRQRDVQSLELAGTVFKGGQPKTLEDYLSDPREIMAFAQQAYYELVGSGLTPVQVTDAIKNTNSQYAEYSPILVNFLDFFGRGSKQYKRFLKNISQATR